jgi:hypothetical protein
LQCYKPDFLQLQSVLFVLLKYNSSKAYTIQLKSLNIYHGWFILNCLYAIVGRLTDNIPDNTHFAMAGNQNGKNQREW